MSAAQHTPGQTLIQRQDACVALLEPIHRRFITLGIYGGGAYAGMRSRVKHQHIAVMRAAGYSQREAAESAQQCDDVARLNADHELLMAQMGAKATGSAT